MTHTLRTHCRANLLTMPGVPEHPRRLCLTACQYWHKALLRVCRYWHMTLQGLYQRF